MVNASARYEAIEDSLPPDSAKKHDELIFRAELFYLIVKLKRFSVSRFVPLFVAIIAHHGWSTMVDYGQNARRTSQRL